MQKYKNRMLKVIKQEQNVAAQGASSNNRLPIQEVVGIPSSLYNWNHSSDTEEKANSPALFAPTRVGNWATNCSSPYDFGLPDFNQLTPAQNNKMMFGHSPHTQSNSAERPGANERRNMNNNYNYDANIEALLKKQTVPVICSTDDIIQEQQQNSGAYVNTHFNFNAVANSSWSSNHSGAMYTQSNFVGWPAVNGRSSMNSISNHEANVEALLENSVVPLIDLTTDSDYKQQAIATAQLNFNSVANSRWPCNLSGATYEPAYEDGSWGLTCGNVNEQNDVQNVVVPNPNNDPVFVNPHNIPMSFASSSEQNMNNTVIPTVADSEFSIFSGSFNDEVAWLFNNYPDATGSAESAVFRNENYGSGDISGGSTMIKQEDDTVSVDIGFESFDSSECNYLPYLA
jgi:hypothetical protein